MVLDELVEVIDETQCFFKTPLTDRRHSRVAHSNTATRFTILSPDLFLCYMYASLEPALEMSGTDQQQEERSFLMSC